MISARVAVFAALLGLAVASCPNQCSGHGRCSEFDKCICFRQQGTYSPYRYGYTGADCSLRTCPLGRAYDRISTATASISPMVFKRSIAVAGAASNDKLQVVFAPDVQDDAFRALRRDQKFFVRVMTTSTAYPYGTFAWRAEEEEYFSQEYPIGDFMSATTGLPLAVTGTDGYNTGVYVYFDKQKSNTDDFTTTPGEIEAGDLYEFTLYYNEGDNFDASDSNTAHQLIECSGRGICDYNSGKCACLGGYTGEACQRTVCPSSCSGHGSCSSQLRFATDGLAGNAAGYTSYEKEQQYGCKCDKGYRGPDCSQAECPSGEDPMGGEGGAEGRDCSGRGLCDYATGVCKCFKGFYGERCESQTTLV